MRKLPARGNGSSQIGQLQATNKKAGTHFLIAGCVPVYVCAWDWQRQQDLRRSRLDGVKATREQPGWQE
jgi:hypothetical protein